MGWLTLVFTILFVAIISLKLYLKLTRRWCRSKVCLVDKTAIITGASAGIGYETALDFAKRGARVILACRNSVKTEEIRTRIINQTGNKNILIKLVDFASFDSVRAFAKDVNETVDRVDILVNNAGTVGFENKKTEDGLPWVMQVNYFSSVLLTLLLVDLLKKSGSSRIINVSSLGAKSAKKFNLNNIDQIPPGRQAYPNSKLGNILFTQELAKKLGGSRVTTYSLHPGLVDSDIFDNMSGLLKVVFLIIIKIFSITCEEGAQTSIYCSVTQGIERYNGEHFDNCRRIDPYKTARHPDLASKLWKKTEELINLKPNENPF